MNDVELSNWIDELRKSTPIFIEKMRDDKVAGKYRLSWSGDIAPPQTHWGLAQTTFAARVLHIFNQISNSLQKDLSGYICTFRHKDGFFYDDYAARRSFQKRFFETFKRRSLAPILNEENKRAETRQAIAALINLNYQGPLNVVVSLTSKKEVEKYVRSLDWKNPWGAASHVNHLIFFLVYCSGLSKSDLNEIVMLIEKKLLEIDVYGLTEDVDLKIGAAMKILMGMSLVKHDEKWVNKEILDICLGCFKKNDACTNFNAIYVITKCLSHFSYREDEAKQALLTSVGYWKDNFYWPDFGGFSFYKNRSIDFYYGAKLTMSKSEPDLHGTAMFIWGVFLVSKVFGLDVKFGLNEPVL